MKGLASLLLVLVAFTHYAPDLLASFYSDPQRAARALFYVARGIEGTVLWCVLWWVLTPYRIRSTAGSWGVAVACYWGAFEEAQTAICRLAVGIERAPSPTLYAGMCDVLTDQPVYMLTLSVVCVSLMMLLRQHHNKGDPPP